MSLTNTIFEIHMHKNAFYFTGGQVKLPDPSWIYGEMMHRQRGEVKTTNRKSLATSLN